MRARTTASLGFDSLFLVDHFYGLFDASDARQEACALLAVMPLT
ncbi:MAG TPA: hypothetical protein VE420_00670 [Gemmatimonadales bacterium]|nr:hypothetical protein [Gemmatimonadales bacterium]